MYAYDEIHGAYIGGKKHVRFKTGAMAAVAPVGALLMDVVSNWCWRVG